MTRRVGPFTSQYLRDYPADAARVLEQFPVQITAQFLGLIDVKTAAGVVQRMLPAEATRCIEQLPLEQTTVLLTEMAPIAASRLVRSMDQHTAVRILDSLPSRIRGSVRQLSQHPEQSVGMIMNAKPFLLPHTITVGDAIRRIRRIDIPHVWEIFVIDESYKLQGSVRVGELIAAKSMMLLDAVMTRNVPSFLVRETLARVAAHPEWKSYRSLPVVERDGTMVGTIEYETMIEALAHSDREREESDSLGSILNLFRLYWIIIADLIEALLSQRKGHIENHEG